MAFKYDICSADMSSNSRYGYYELSSDIYSLLIVYFVGSDLIPIADTRSVSKLETLELALALAFFSLCGSVARTGLENLTGFENGSTKWVNFAGSLLMGLREVFGPKLSILHGMGLSGTLSSLSTYLIVEFFNVTSPKSNWPTYGYGVPLFMADLIIEIAVSFSGFQMGIHLASFCELYLPVNFIRDPILELWYLRATATLGVAGWVTVVVLAVVMGSERNLPLIASFSPFGTWLRFYLTRFNKPYYKLGTFAANMLSVALACMFRILRSSVTSSTLQRQVLYSLTRGFCACLSTVPMVIVEMYSLPLWRAYAYGVVTVFSGCCIVVIILGSYSWSN